MIFLLFACASLDGSPVLTDTEAYTNREIVVSVTNEMHIKQLEKDFNLSELEYLPQIGVAILEVDTQQDLKEVIKTIQETDQYEFAEPNFMTFSTAFRSNDPYSGYQWHLDKLNIKDAWAYNQGEGITVAILDTGVKPNGVDGIENLLPGYDTYNRTENADDYNGHGTHVASTVAQRSNNGIGEASVAPMANILPVKVMSNDGYGDNIALAQGIVFAVDNGADVINMSLGNPYTSETVKRAVEYAAQNDVVLIAATGNSYASRIYYPAAYTEVIAVGASRYNNTKSAYSNYGSGIDVLAPGGDLSRDDNRDGYADGILQETYEYGEWTSPFYEGTSMASPQVAGIAALIMAEGVRDPETVRSILQTTARNTGPQGYDSYSGYGVVNAAAAVAMAAGNSLEVPLDTPEPDVQEQTTELRILNESGYVDGNIFTIRWTTTVPANSYIDFDSYDSVGNDELTTDHTLRLAGTSNTTYSFTIRSEDAKGQVVEKGPFTINL
ncbi:MAG: S8 family peptidase [Myxococcota bacterium]